MYCQHCGAETAQELNYCKRCGGSLNLPATNAPREVRPALSNGAAWAIGASMLGIVVLPLGIMISAIIELSHKGAPPDVFKVLIIFVSLVILGSVALLTWFWMHLLGVKRAADAGALPSPRQADTNQLGAAAPHALPDARPFSVTEQTTRTLEHVKK
jgi:hypothetical protein